MKNRFSIALVQCCKEKPDSFDNHGKNGSFEQEMEKIMKENRFVFLIYKISYASSTSAFCQYEWVWKRIRMQTHEFGQR